MKNYTKAKCCGNCKWLSNTKEICCKLGYLVGNSDYINNNRNCDDFQEELK